MRDFEAILADGTERFGALLEEAFEAGRVAGRQEASDDLRAKLAGILLPSGTSFQSAAAAREDVVETVVSPETVQVDPDKRASPGSVRPTIERQLWRAKQTGLTTDDVVSQTGIKPNSVRGTLWTLGKEGLAKKHDGRWFPADKLAERQRLIDDEINYDPPSEPSALDGRSEEIEAPGHPEFTTKEPEASSHDVPFE